MRISLTVSNNQEHKWLLKKHTRKVSNLSKENEGRLSLPHLTEEKFSEIEKYEIHVPAQSFCAVCQ